MTETTVGREPVQIVEIQQPFCNNTFGVAPCTASGAADAKCYNTYYTCQDQANFDKGSLSLYFARGTVAEQDFADAPYIIPSLVSVSTSPTKINLGGTNPDAGGLGNRALATITFQDHPHTDRRVDPYISGRSWEGLDRGSFWTKWLIRNLYRQNVPVIIYEGYADEVALLTEDEKFLLTEDGWPFLLEGPTLSQMTKREYVLQSVSGPDASGRVTIQAKDVLAKAEERKAKAPGLSPGRLLAAITGAATSFTVTNATTSDYSASGTLRIDNEVMTYSAVATSGDNISFTITARGTDGTTAAAHNADALVQECLRFTAQAVDDVATTLLTTYAGIASADLDTTGWASEADTYLTGFASLNALITEPMAVSEIMSSLQIETGCFFWWDERAGLVKMKAVRGVTEQPPLLTDANHIIADSFSLTEHPRRRLSQAWLYYDRRDPTKQRSDTANYRSAQIQADLSAESANEYGESQSTEIRALFIATGAQALSTTSKLLTRYRNTPRAAVFEVDAKDRSYWTGDTIRISHPLDVDEFGVRNIATWTVTEAEEVEPGHRVRLVCEDTTLYGKVYVIQANGTADYQGDGSDAYNGAFIGDASGLLSDGENSARIS
jgi:hypothetical protein